MKNMEKMFGRMMVHMKRLVKRDEAVNLRSNSSQDGDDDTGMIMKMDLCTHGKVCIEKPSLDELNHKVVETIYRIQQVFDHEKDTVNDELKATGNFEYMDLRVDEAEHSMEMHLPYLAKVFQGYPVKIVPILVGALSAESEALFGRLLAKYLNDSKNFFSVSSDFCHWGSRFNYMHYDKSHGVIYKSIEALDKMGMDIIETGDPDAFKQYLSETDNTICGRHPISVFLHMLKSTSTKIKIRFLRYEQSSQCKSMRDSSVSYASAVGKVDA
ncbi:Protein MEMO1 [Capsicum chinense]|nr:Protein MEMO1 [Capsicum chinense]